MKQLISILLIILVAATAVFSVSAESGYICGDADCDGEVTVLDATAIQRVLVDLAVSAFNETAADVDSDGLNIIDATHIQRWLVDYEVSAPIGERIGGEDPTQAAQTEVAEPTDPEPTQPEPTQPEPTAQKPTRDPDELPFIPRF